MPLIARQLSFRIERCTLLAWIVVWRAVIVDDSSVDALVFRVRSPCAIASIASVGPEAHSALQFSIVANRCASNAVHPSLSSVVQRADSPSNFISAKTAAPTFIGKRNDYPTTWTSASAPLPIHRFLRRSNPSGPGKSINGWIFLRASQHSSATRCDLGCRRAWRLSW